jgi:aspartyl/asparaginyl-tRNA synthetase
LQSEHERYLVERHFKKPVILYNYPKEIKAFYMRQNEDGQTVGAMDILFPYIGEIVGGSQREERYDRLIQRIASSASTKSHSGGTWTLGASEPHRTAVSAWALSGS